MNRKQTIVVLVTVSLIALFVIFPPYERMRYPRFLGYHLITHPPETNGIPVIDYPRLLIQIGAALVVGAGLYLIFGDGKD